LENQLDVKLFYREKNGVKLTEKGKQLFEIVNKSISSFDFAEKAMK
jgi:bacterial regulatory helix-turn-helix protein, lysR family